MLYVTDLLPERLESGRIHRLYLEFPTDPDRQSCDLPVLYARGSEGSTLVVLAGIHGDEYEGVAAIHRLFERLDPSALTGELLAVPVANPPAVAARTRLSPLDNLNLARTFPGRSEGTPSERLAHVLTEQVISRADFLIDLHAAGTHYSMPTLCGFVAVGEVGDESRKGALAFGAPVVWRHDEVAPGRTLSVAFDRKIPAVYAETTGGSWVRESDVERYVLGVRNVMKHLGILQGAPALDGGPLLVYGGGDLDRCIVAQRSGYLANRVNLLDWVDMGTTLGVLVDMFGQVVEEIRSPQDGRLMMRRETPIIEAGDALYALATK